MKKSGNLGSLSVLLCAIGMTAASFAADSPETNFLARYDIEVRDRDALKSTFKSQAFLDGNRKTTFGFNAHFVELRLQPVSDTEYDIRMIVSPGSTARRPRFDKTFRGQYGIPLLLVADTRQIDVKGTLAIIRTRQATW